MSNNDLVLRLQSRTGYAIERLVLDFESVFMRVPPKPKYPHGLAPIWNIAHIKGNSWLVSLATPIPQTAGAVTNTYNVPFHHKIHEIQVTHTTAAGAPSTDAMLFQYLTESTTPGLYVEQYVVAANTTGMIEISFMDEAGRPHPPLNHRFVTNTTNLHLVNVTVHLEVLKD